MARTMALCHPKVEWTVPEDGTTYPEAVRESVGGSKSGSKASTTTDYEVQRIIDCGGNEVLVEAIEVGRGASQWR